MTRKEAEIKAQIIDVQGGYTVKLVTELFNSFESRSCKNCKFCLEGSNNYDIKDKQ